MKKNKNHRINTFLTINSLGGKRINPTYFHFPIDGKVSLIQYDKNKLSIFIYFYLLVFSVKRFVDFKVLLIYINSETFYFWIFLNLITLIMIPLNSSLSISYLFASKFLWKLGCHVLKGHFPLRISYPQTLLLHPKF